MCLVYHYTVGSNFEKIMLSKVLKLATKGIPNNTKPVLWFSSNQFWEHTATKLMSNGYGHTREGTMEDMLMLGMFRFAIDSSKTLHFKKLKKAAKMSNKEVWMLKTAAKHMGGKHKEWYGVLNELDISECLSIEEFVGNKWVKADITT